MCDSSNTYLTHAISDYIMQESLLKQQTIEKSVSKKLIGKNSFEKKSCATNFEICYNLQIFCTEKVQTFDTNF